MQRFSFIVVALGAAAQAAAESGEGKGNPFAGDIGNALWTLVVFVLVVVVLGKFAWKPILGALQKREDFIRDSLAQAKQDREDAERRLKEYTEKVLAARAEATAIVDEGRRDAEVVKRGIEDEAKSEAKAILERGKREIAIATDTAVKELYTLGAKLAIEVAGRILRKELNPREHERLIAESIDELQEAAGN